MALDGSGRVEHVAVAVGDRVAAGDVLLRLDSDVLERAVQADDQETLARLLGKLLQSGDRATVRRNFKPVPFYEPRIMVGSEGVATVTGDLPDNLTNFKLRAKASSDCPRP